MSNPKVRVTLALLILIVSIAVAGMLLTSATSRQTRTSGQPMTFVIADKDGIQTASFERTALAIFTANSTLVLSSTPSFARILCHELLRQLTMPVVQPTTSLVPPTIIGQPCAPAYLA